MRLGFKLLSQTLKALTLPCFGLQDSIVPHLKELIYICLEIKIIAGSTFKILYCCTVKHINFTTLAIFITVQNLIFTILINDLYWQT